MSKGQLIAGILLLVGLGIGAYVLQTKSKQSVSQSYPLPTFSQVSPSVAQQKSLQSKDADTVTQDYYNWYVACQQRVNTVDTFHGGTLNPKQECAYNRTDVLTDDLVNKLQQVVASDPMLCAQNIPQKVTYEKAVVATKGKASVVVHTIWGASAPQNIHVGLQETNNQWKIVAIDCNH